MRVIALVTLSLTLGACGSRAAMVSTDGSPAERTTPVPGPAPSPTPDPTPAPDASLRPVVDAALPARNCGENSDCGPGEFCQKDGHCLVTGAAAGHCEPRPPSCPVYFTCPAVCGCDGNSYCGACEAHAAGVSVAIGGGCLAPDCAGLEVLYEAEVKLGKQCCLACKNSVVQCSVKIPSQLTCGCDTYVSYETPKLIQIRTEWLARGCQFQVYCPAIDCMPVAASQCVAVNAPPGPGAGTCLDLAAE